MKKQTKVRIARALTKLVRPCRFYEAQETPKGQKLKCRYDGSRRNRCKTSSCPHFSPTTRWRIARWFGMVR